MTEQSYERSPFRLKMGRILQERYQAQAERLAQQCQQAGLPAKEVKLLCKFAQYEARKPADLLDWVKRRAVKRQTTWGKVAEAWLEPLQEIRQWGKTQTEDLMECVWCQSILVEMVLSYLVSVKIV